MRNPGQDAGKGWSVVRLDGQSVGSAAGVADVASVARSATAAGQRVAIVVSSLRVQREKSVVDRLVHAASHCLAASGSPRSRPRNTTHHLSTKPICPHTRLLSQLERDLVQLIRRAIRGGQHSAILGQDAELFVADSVARLREFLAAIEIVGELSPTSMDSLIAAGDAMTAYIVTAALQSMGLPAKLIQTNDLMSSNHSYEVMDDHFFDQVVSNLSELISQQVINDAQNVIPIFTAPHHQTFTSSTPTSVVSTVWTRAWAPILPAGRHEISRLVRLSSSAASEKTTDFSVALPSNSFAPQTPPPPASFF
ncbi:hypothetical protein BC830DRAFT_650134 [Chytriomyces sp. MP71]|nr:hypothetical protein BC830DRAFT_650134 [Chytriomyces sp. MP71]